MPTAVSLTILFASSIFSSCALVSFTEKKEGAIPSVFQERPWKSPYDTQKTMRPAGRILPFGGSYK